MKKSTFLRKYEILFASLFVIVTVIGMSIYFLLPNFTKVQTILSQRKELTQKRILLEKKDNALSALDIKFYGRLMGKLANVIPSSKDFSSLFATFDNLQTKTGVSILRTDLQFGVISTPSGSLSSRTVTSKPSAIPVTVIVAGTLPQLKSFLEALYDLSGRIILVKDIDIDLSGGEFVRATIVGQAYYYSASVNIGKLETLLPQVDEKKQDLLKKIDLAQTVLSENQAEAVSTGKSNLFE